ncbi:MAG: hypothetical protein KGD63_09455 [Candidatus Lokiarchaeota archaeon]|nr:hypothetical protein [Candidatus Lokiarchaeota archaeon]
MVIFNGFLVSFVTMVLLLVFHFNIEYNQFPSIIYLEITTLFFFIFSFTDTLSLLFENEFLARISGISLFTLVISLFSFINYTMKETILSFQFVIIYCIGILLIYIAFQPDAVTKVSILGYSRITWSGSFLIGASIFHLLVPIYGFYWVLMTYLNSPILLKKDSKILFISLTISLVGIIVFYILSMLIDILNLFLSIAQLIGTIGIFIVIFRKPLILMVLPFNINHLIVRDHAGNLLFIHHWDNSATNENLFTGFLNAIELMSEELMKLGGLIEIDLQNGNLTLIRTNYIIVGLVASKVSKLLKNSLIEFTSDFDKKFERVLKKSSIDINEYRSAFKLIKKHFPQIPYRLTQDEKSILTLSSQYTTIPNQLQNKYKDMFGDEKEYGEIINDLARSPISMSSDFLDLYDELKDDLDKIDSKKDEIGGNTLE